MTDDLFRGHGVEIRLNDSKADFLKIMETLERCGVSSGNKLYQSCHILHKQKRYAIVHFKEMFAFDGKNTDFSEEDKARRNLIVSLLIQWNLCTLVDENEKLEPIAPLSKIKVITHKQRDDWELIQKYSMGSKKRVSQKD